LLLAASLVPLANAQTPLDCTAQGFIRFANTSPDAGGFDAVIGGRIVATNVAFPQTSAPIPVPVGTVRVQLYHTGKTTLLVLPMDVPVTGGSRTTISLSGQASTGGQQPTSTVGTQVLADDTTPPAAGQAKVRVVQASADAGTVDVRAGDQVIASNLLSGSTSPYVELPAGTYPIRVTQSGTGEVLLGPIDVQLAAARNYTFTTTGLVSNRTFALQTVVDQAFDAQARFVHASPNSPAFDVIADGRTIVSNLTANNATGYLAMPAGGVCTVLVQTGTTMRTCDPASLTFDSATKSTVVFSGFYNGSPPLTIRLYDDETTPPAADRAKLRVIQAIADAPVVDVLAGDQVIVSNLAFPNASDFVDVAPGTLQLRLNQAGTKTTVLGPIDVTLTGGQVATVVLRGTVAGGTMTQTLLSDAAGN
jgi:hypothetical protein